jgi:hypothetical protein
MKDRLKDLADKAAELATKSSRSALEALESGRDYIDRNKDGWRESLGTAKDVSVEYGGAAGCEMADRLRGAYTWLAYSEERERQLRDDIKAQGGLYRECLRSRSNMDTLVVGGESLTRMLAVGEVPAEIEAAFAAAYPGLASETNFLDHASSLDASQLPGFLAGIKGKLFEIQYVEMLNDGLLPDGYTAQLAERANQAGWDIAIVGPDDAIVDVLQAKATDSVGYVKDAIEQYPAIDVVTTEEVYSHLVMSGVGVEVTNSGIADAGLEEAVGDAALAGDVVADFMPPVISLAFIAFTSYRDENLTLYQKARTAGERSGAVYLATLIGGAIGEGTDSFWLGVAGTLVSKLFGDKSAQRAKLIDLLQRTKKTNQGLLDRMQTLPAPN